MSAYQEDSDLERRQTHQERSSSACQLVFLIERILEAALSIIMKILAEVTDDARTAFRVLLFIIWACVGIIQGINIVAYEAYSGLVGQRQQFLEFRDK